MHDDAFCHQSHMSHTDMSKQMVMVLKLQVLLLDEITVDLDVVGRLQLLDFFKAECEERGATILYATHIFDGLEGWITHMAYMEEGQIKKGEPRLHYHLPTLSAVCSALPFLQKLMKSGCSA
jgi:energy-coupling factor transporter ATP-binding protein EcfA2